MADFERCQSNEYKAVHVWSIENLDSMMEMKRVIKSDEFTCSDDPKQFKFHIWSKFGKDADGWLSVYVSTSKKTTCFVRKYKFTAYDENINELESITVQFKSILKYPGNGLNKFYSLSKIRDSSSNLIRLKCEVFYDGDPAKTDSTTVEPRDPNLPINMISLFDSTKYADVTFLVEGEKIKAHKNILIARSNYFETMFDSGMQECATNEVEIQDAQPLEFKEFLKFLYSGLPPKDLPKIARSLLPLADRYGTMVLEKMCISAIRGSVSPSNVIEVLLLSDLYDCEELLQICIPMFKKNVKELKKAASWNLLLEKPKLMAKLLESFGE